MKVENATMSFIIQRESTTIEIHDQNAALTICQVTITPNQLSGLLSGMGYVKCDSVEVFNLHKIGKKHENKDFSFEIPDSIDTRHKELLNQIAIEALKSGNMAEWTPDKNYSSQNSFYKKDGKNYAQCVIRRWI